MEKLENAIIEIKKAFPAMKILENEPMSAHSSMRVGGAIRALASPSDVSSLTKLCCILKEHELAPLMLGNCTNIVFPDEGMSEVFAICTEKLTKLFLLPDGAIYAEAGVPLSRLAAFAQQNALAGLEFASGIPGTVGGGLMMNAGAYGGEMKDVLESVTFLDDTLELRVLPAKDLAMGYRTSVFEQHPDWCILSATVVLHRGNGAEVLARMKELLGKRREKQPLEWPSAGSTFKRPAGAFAAALIDQCGLRGYRHGGAAVSDKHCGFVVNLGGATCADVLALCDEVRAIVKEKTGYDLEKEIRVVR